MYQGENVDDHLKPLSGRNSVVPYKQLFTIRMTRREWTDYSDRTISGTDSE